MTKITLLSPVHVGTGQMVEPVCYRISNGTGFRYTLADIAGAMKNPASLLDKSVLNRIIQADSKAEYYQIFGQSDIKARPLYKLEWKTGKDIYGSQNTQKKGSSGGSSVMIHEQIKALGKPVIPGSSLKGALECAFKYNYLKQHLNQIRNNLGMIADEKKLYKDRTPDTFLLSMVYGLSRNEIRRGDYEEFLKRLYGCLRVNDLQFERMVMLELDRRNQDSSNKDLPMGLAECISQNDVCKTDCLFEIQTELVNNLKYEFLNGKNPPFVQEIYQELIDSF